MGILKLKNLLDEIAEALARSRTRPLPPPPIPVPVPVPGPNAPPANPPAPPVAGPKPADTPTAPANTGVNTDDAFTGDQTSMGEAIRLENRKRRRNKNCCKPFEFLNVWLTKGNPLANKLPPGVTFTDQDFSRFPGSRVAFMRGYWYQAQVTGIWEYLAKSASGASVWADGERSARCWLQEAKYQMPLRNTGPTEIPYTPSEEPAARIERQFENYGKVCNNPAPPAKPCWNIGLEVYVSRRGGPVRYYYGLLVRNAIEGVVLWRPVPQEGLAEIDDAYRQLERRKKN